jgi:hypothetical protein
LPAALATASFDLRNAGYITACILQVIVCIKWFDARYAEAALEADGLGKRNSDSVRWRGFRRGASGLIAHGLPTGFQKGVRQPLVTGRTREHDRTDHSRNCAGGGLSRI